MREKAGQRKGSRCQRLARGMKPDLGLRSRNLPRDPPGLTTAYSLRFPVSLRVRSSPSTTTTFSLLALRCSTSNVPMSLDTNKCDSLPTSRWKCVRNTEDLFKYCDRILCYNKKKETNRFDRKNIKRKNNTNEIRFRFLL